MRVGGQCDGTGRRGGGGELRCMEPACAGRVCACRSWPACAGSIANQVPKLPYPPPTCPRVAPFARPPAGLYLCCAAAPPPHRCCAAAGDSQLNSDAVFRHLLSSIAVSQKLILQQFGTLTTLVVSREPGPQGGRGRPAGRAGVSGRSGGQPRRGAGVSDGALPVTRGLKTRGRRRLRRGDGEPAMRVCCLPS